MLPKNHRNRLLVILNTAAHNGAVRQLSLWLPYLNPEMWHCCIVFLREAGALSDEVVPTGAPVFSHILRSRFDPFVVPRILSISCRFKPDIIFTIDEQNSMILGRLAGAVARSSVVHAIHSTPSPERTRLPWWNRVTFGLVSRVVAVTENHRLALEKIGIPPDRIHCVVNAVPSAVADYNHRLSSPTVTAAYLGVLRKEKRVDVLLRAFALVSDEQPYFHLSIIGSGPLEWELRQLADELGIQKRIEWHGWQMQVTPFLNEADFLVLPSEPGVETLSMAVLEAMALGLPVISTDVGSMRMAVVPETGIIIPHGDVAALAEAMRKMVSNRHLRVRMGEEARLRQEKLFSVDRLRNDMKRCMESLANQRRGR